MKSKQYRNRVSRKPALSTISVGVMAALIAGSAGATGAGGEADYSDNSTAAQVIGATSSYSNPYNVSNINAAVIGTQGGNNTTNSGTASQGSTSVTDNAIAAKAIANTITNTLSLSDIDSPSPANSGNKGLVFLGNAINNGDAGGPGTAVISSLVDSTRLDNSTSGSAPGSTSINNNTISATTLVNTTASTINGQVPVGYTSATPGEFKLGTDGSRSFTSTATIVSASAQKTTEAGSSATVTSNAVTLNITPPSGSTITADASLTGNSVSANVKANSAASSIGLQAASSTFTGSAVLSNTQVSEDARPNALNDASTIAAVISQNPSQTSLGNSVLGGKLAVTGNTISSSAIVNESLGNSISLGSLAFTGGGTAMPGVKLNGYGNINDSASLGMDVKADLVMVNAQSNQTDSDEPKAIVSAKTSNGRVTAVSDALTNGTINVSANTIQSIAKGNAASSTLASTATPASFSGSAALASQQENVYSDVTATTSTATISSKVLAVTGGNNSVTSNTQSAEARGNVVDQSLTLAATTLNQSAAPTTTTALTSGVSIIGPVTVGSLQTNSNATVSATNSSSSATLTTNAVSASTLSLSQNTQSALALANIAGNTLSLSGTSVGAGAGIANVQQLSNTSPVAANLTGANISATSSDITNSTNSVASNIQSADARGNASNQLLTLTTTTLNTGNSSGMTTLGDGVGIVNATGPVTVSNLQVNTSSSLSAVNSNSAADLIVQGTSKVTGSTLSVFNNTQSALALANNAANTLSLSGTSVTGSAGIANVQQLSNASTVTASLTDAASYLSTLAVDSSAVSVKNNTAKASAFGNVSANALGVVATTVTGIAAGTLGSTVTYDSAITPSNKVLTSSVNSGYGLRNDQSVLSDISATANNSLSGSSAFRVKTSDVTNSQILNTGNAFSAVAEGNTATSGITLNANSITSPSNSALANISSTQAVNAAITATAIPSGVAKTTISGAVNASTVSANSNSLLALAIGSNANNTLAVIKPTNSVASTGNSIAVGSTIAGDSSTSNTLAFFDLQNVQSGQGSVTATQRTIVSSPDMGISITGNVNGSTLTADANTSSASATSNTATNNLSMNVGSLTSSSALQNVQVSGANVIALIGVTGSAAVAAVAPKIDEASAQTANYTTGDANINGTTLVVNANKKVAFSTANLSGNTQTEVETYFVSLGFNLSNHVVTAFGGSNTSKSFNVSKFRNFSQNANLDGTTYFKYDGPVIPGKDGTVGKPNQGGVTLTVSSLVDKSELSVSGNATSGFAAGNSATNITSLQGNNIASANSSLTIAKTATGIDGSTANSVNADYMLQNKQNFTSQSVGNVINSDVFGTMAIAAGSLPSITNSSLTVANNTQSATSVGNTATNSLALQANSVTAASALQSSQITGAVISASSNLEMFTPGSVANSSVLVSGNANRSLAVMNDVTNTVSVAGTQVGNGKVGTTVVTGFSAGTSAENVLSNYQGSTQQPTVVNGVTQTYNSVSSTATTNLYNQEAIAATQAVLTKSSLSLSGNSTTAEASTNRANNMASANGASTQAASVAIGNVQQNVVAVTATASTAANVVLTSAPLNSSVLIGNNSTTSLARGNTASNTLDSLAGSIYGVALNGMSSFDTNKVLTVSANAGISNAQSNSNAVSASSTATYRVALNSGDTSGVVNVSGNQVVAQAYGNNVTNTMTLNALNSNLPTSAIASYQTNSGAITATASSASFGISSVSGAVTNSNLRTTGNQVTATAVGNSVVSAMLAR